MNLRQVMVAAIRHELTHRGRLVEAATARLLQHSPSGVVQRVIGRHDALRQRLIVAGQQQIERRDQRLRLAARALDSVSPLATLDRGYAIVSDASTGRVLTDATGVEPGRTITARLATGKLEATVTRSTTRDDDDR